MRIKAKRYGQDIVIIDFVSVYDRSIKVIYVDTDGDISACYLDSNDLKIVDKEYLPEGNENIFAPPPKKNSSTKDEDIFAPIPMRWTTSG